MSIPEHRQQNVAQAVAELQKLKVPAAHISRYIDRIPDDRVRLFLWASMALAAAFMAERESRLEDEEGESQ